MHVVLLYKKSAQPEHVKEGREKKIKFYDFHRDVRMQKEKYFAWGMKYE